MSLFVVFFECLVMIMVGGIGGYIFFGLVVVCVLCECGVLVIWFGVDGVMEICLVLQYGIYIDMLVISGLCGKGMLVLIGVLWCLLCVVCVVGFLICDCQLCVVIVFGGFVFGLGGLVVCLYGLLLLVYEQNCVLGLINCVLLCVVWCILIGFLGSFVVCEEVVGNLVCVEIVVIVIFELCLVNCQGLLCLLVFGGSQGVCVLNNVVFKVLVVLGVCVVIDVCYQSGEKLYVEVVIVYCEVGVIVQVDVFIVDMVEVYVWVDLVVCCFGVFILVELCVVGVGSVLVLFVVVVDDYQICNVEYLVECGVVVLLKQDEMLVMYLQGVLYELFENFV